MSVAKKFAALGAAAAISATGLVAATGVSANAANVTKSVTYSCDLGALAPLVGNKPANVTAAYSIPAFPSTIPVGTKVPQKSISAKITLPKEVAALVVNQFHGSIDGSMNGNLSFGSKSADASLTIPEGTTITDASKDATVNASGTLAGFTADAAGTQAVKLPSVVHAEFQSGALAVDCNALSGSDLSLGSVTVAKSSTGGHTTSPALKAAQAKLAKDQKALAAAKKALKKAKGHKKVVLKKKVAKLTKAVKADQAKIKSLSK